MAAVSENDREDSGGVVNARSDDSKGRRIRRENMVQDSDSNFDAEQIAHISFNK